MTTERLVKLERMAMYSKSLASISDNSVLNAFISSGPRKLNYRRYYLLVLTGNIQKNYPTQKIEVRLVAIKSDYFSSFFANTPFNLKNVITSFTQLFTSVVRLIAIQVGHSYLHSMYVQRNLGVFRFINMGFTTLILHIFLCIKSIYLSINVSIDVSIYISVFKLHILLKKKCMYLFMFLSMYISIYQCIYLSIYVSIYIYI